MADPPILIPPKMVKPEDLHHHALEQLPNLAYCINDNPRWGEEVVICSWQICILLSCWFYFVYVVKMVVSWWWKLGKEVAQFFLVYRVDFVKI